MTAYGFGLVCCWLPAFSMFSSPFSATVTIFGSITVNSSHIGGIQPASTRCLICSTVPPLVALVMAQAASFRVLKSAFPSNSIMLGKMLASIVACIWCRLPAAMFEIVQQASFRSASRDELSSCRMEGKALQFRISCVWLSFPVTMLPTARKAADTTLLLLCDSSSIRRRQQPALMTASMLSFDPSDR
uniref:Putative secreted peptide n=1 Tax=Anopheles braziliensis TaxID=58242 RepID=A0A2M3ZMZ7_9DIPT